RRLDLGAVANDARVAEQAPDVVVAEPGDRVGLEARERGPERLALAQDRQPRQAGLERLERHPLEQAALVGDRAAPFLVVVALVEGVAVPEAARHSTGGRSIIAPLPTAGRSWRPERLRSLRRVAGHRSAARGELSPPLSGSAPRRRFDTHVWTPGSGGLDPGGLTSPASRPRAGRGRPRRPPRRGSRSRGT